MAFGLTLEGADSKPACVGLKLVAFGWISAFFDLKLGEIGSIFVQFGGAAFGILLRYSSFGTNWNFPHKRHDVVQNFEHAH